MRKRHRQRGRNKGDMQRDIYSRHGWQFRIRIPNRKRTQDTQEKFINGGLRQERLHTSAWGGIQFKRNIKGIFGGPRGRGGGRLNFISV